MRILVYFRELRFGGVHTYLKHQVAFLVNQGHEVWVSYANENTRDLFAQLGAKTFANKELVRYLYRIDKDIKALWRVYHFCRRQQIDCIFSHTSKGGAIARFAGLLARIPRRIHVIHGFSFHEHSTVVEKGVGRCIERLLSAMATRLISVNAADKDLAIKNRICHPWKIKTIYNGTPVPKKSQLLSAQEKERFLKANGFKADHFLILFVGRLMRQKNPLFLVEAFSRIPHAKAHLIIIGEGPLEQNLKWSIHEKKLNHRIHLLGFRPDVDLWYQVCSVFVLPSLWEGLPMTLLEAMAAGTCCVATNIKGNRECIKHNQDGLLIPCRDDCSLSDTIISLMHDPVYRGRLGDAARRKVTEVFSVQRMCEETHRVLCNESG